MANWIITFLLVSTAVPLILAQANDYRKAKLIEIKPQSQFQWQKIVELSTNSNSETLIDQPSKRSTKISALISQSAWEGFKDGFLDNNQFSYSILDHDFSRQMENDPVLNPDGYAYTWTHNRYWRMSREPNVGYPNCSGTDINRNFKFHWGTVGVSKNPCLEIYPGPKAFSAVESRNLAKTLLSLQDKVKFYMNMHMATEPGDWFVPYGNQTNCYPPDVKELKSLARKACRAIKKRSGKQYIVGSPADIIYEVSGDIMSWVKQSTKIKYTHAMELFNKSFLFPLSEIIPTAQDIMAAFQVIAEHIANEEN